MTFNYQKPVFHSLKARKSKSSTDLVSENPVLIWHLTCLYEIEEGTTARTVPAAAFRMALITIEDGTLVT